MIRIINSSLQPLAIIDKLILSPEVFEEVNREYTFSFSAILDGSKSKYFNYQNKVEVENNYFNIVYTKERRNTDDTLTIDVDCEHVSYELNGDSSNPDDPYIVENYADYGTPTELMTRLLSGTSFTVGQVDFTALTTLAVNEKTTKRGILIALAVQLGGELKFSKYQISLLTRRGADRGVRFRYKKNILSVTRITDARTKTNGLPTVSYETDVAELEFAQGYGANEHYELGDTVYVYDPDLNILDVPQRIVKESHNPLERMQGKVTIANFVPDMSDAIIKLQQGTIRNGSTYNGCSISPENGFKAVRGDKKTQTIMNATSGFKIQKGDGSGNSWTDQFYIDTDGNVHMQGGYISWGGVSAPSYSQLNGGNPPLTYIDQYGIYTGTLTANQINAINGIVLGANASIQWGSLPSLPSASQIGARPNTWVPAKNELGQWTTYIDAYGIYTGTVNANQVNTSGLSAEKIYQPGSSSNYGVIGGTYGDLALYYNNNEYFRVYNDFTAVSLKAWNGSSSPTTFLKSSGSLTNLYGTWNFGSATVTNLPVSWSNISSNPFSGYSPSNFARSYYGNDIRINWSNYGGTNGCLEVWNGTTFKGKIDIN